MPNYAEKQCLICGKTFAPLSGASKYCSNACRKVVKQRGDKLYYEENKDWILEDKRSKHIPAPTQIKECKMCGKKFIRNGRQLFCNETCSQKWHSIQPERINRKRMQGKIRYDSIKSTPEGQKKLRQQSRDSRARHHEVHGISSSTAAKRRSVRRRLDDSLRSRFHQWIKREGSSKKHSMDVYCGCSRKEMIHWLESHFEDWMTWENFGHGAGHWSIDHIRPLSSFKGTEKQAMCAWNYRNLRPLEFIENTGLKREKYTPNDENNWQKHMLQHGWEGDLFLLFNTEK